MKAGLPFEILLVDHDADDRFFMDEAFKQIGYEAEVKKFINGGDLLRYLEQIDPSLYPSLIVLNDNLLGQNAKTIMYALKANPAWQYIPVIIYSGLVVQSRKEELLKVGSFAYINKGESFEEIVDIAQKLKKIAESAPFKTKDNL